MKFYDFHPKISDFCYEVHLGLSQSQKSISPKYFYDEEGSNLFNQITQLEEYYLTNLEIKILQDKADDIRNVLGPGRTIIEYGCGSSEKIHFLLRCLEKAKAYVAIDISKEHLQNMTEKLSQDYPEVQIYAICADFTESIILPIDLKDSEKRPIAFFPGSSIGNFEPKDAISFLEEIGEAVGKGGYLLIGVDQKKSRHVLEAAYNDRAGITEKFNKNLLVRINRECGTNFKIENFYHQAFYNQALGRIEMHLVSLVKQKIFFRGQDITFEEGESIHTENSYKYYPQEFQELALKAKWHPVKFWTDPQEYFSFHYFVRE